MTVAMGIAKRYYKVPGCNDQDANWHYITKDMGDVLLVEVGPGPRWGHGVRVTFKRADMAVIGSQHVA